MQKQTYRLLLVCFLSISMTASQEARILINPATVNISLYEEIIFICTAIAHHINWKANETPVDDLDEGFFAHPILIYNLSESSYTGQLSVVGSHATNATIITCKASLLVGGKFTTATSNPALLLVQGLLGAVTDLILNLINSSTVAVSWNPPYTLERVPILYYRVKNNDSHNETVLNPTVYLTFEPVQIESNIVITVIPVNKVGDGMATSQTLFITTSSIIYEGAFTDSVSTTSSLIVTTITEQFHSTPSYTPIQNTPKLSTYNNNIIAISATLIVLLIVTSGAIMCTFIIIIYKRRKRSRKKKLETVVMTENNPAYGYVTRSQIVTRKNSAYEIVKINT